MNEKKTIKSELISSQGDSVNVFKKDYREKAHLQKGINPQVIDDLVDYILRVKPESKEKPIRLLDLCCGDGGSTYLLLSQLDKNKIQVKSLVGYDISPAQIGVAAEYAQLDTRLSFEVRDINTLVEKDSFDVVLSLFGLHWIDNLGSVAVKIQQCLKPEGILMFFVPLETEHLFELRSKLIQSTKWGEKFNGFYLKPFISNSNHYFEVFALLFSYENEGGIYYADNIDFEQNRFADFINSWMQEIRYLEQENDRIQYTDDLIASIPDSPEICSDVKKITTVDNEQKIRVYGRYSWFHFQNKTQEIAPTQSNTVVL
jgi:SAM-dependent methyltransferase